MKTILVAIVALAFVSCATLKETDFVAVERPPSPPGTLFSFDAQKEGTSTGISVGVVAANYTADVRLGGPLDNRASALATELRNAMSRDVQRVLVAKGFSVAGEFSTLERMTFPEKDRTTMVLVPTITLSMLYQPSAVNKVYWRSRGISGPPQEEPFKIYRAKQVMMGGEKFEQRGQFTVRGSVDLQLLEPLTGQTLWVKSIPINESSRNWTWYFWRDEIKDDKGNVVRTEDHPVEGYDGRDAALSTLLADAYRTTMMQFATYLSRDEFVQLKGDATKLKDRWRASGK